jgi:uncharacterized protein (TIGR03067 family)
MRRKGLLALFTWFALLSVAGGNDEADRKALQGTWRPQSAQLAGAEFPAVVLKSITLVIDGDRYKVTATESVDEGTTTIDSSKSPKHMTIKGTKGPNEGKTFLAIYEIKGDTLTVCYDLSGKAFPTEFKSAADTQLYLSRYQREKP